MARGKQGNTKAAAKKKERIEQQRKVDARVKIVKVANSQVDPLDALPSFKKFSKGDITCSLRTVRAVNLDEPTKTWLMDLLTRNMQKMYEDSTWKWDARKKSEEMFDDDAWFLIAEREEDNSKIGFSHFRFDMDYDDEVLYVYEIQLEQEYRRKGLGRFMMQVLEMLSFKNDMRKIMLTVFKFNYDAQRFFKQIMKFETDETTPEEDDVDGDVDIEILSKMNKRKIAREREEQENASRAANGVPLTSGP